MSTLTYCVEILYGNPLGMAQFISYVRLVGTHQDCSQKPDRSTSSHKPVKEIKRRTSVRGTR
jgi:hypothetical protein